MSDLIENKVIDNYKEHELHTIADIKCSSCYGVDKETREIIKLTQLNTIRDIQIALLKKKKDGMIISDETLLTIEEVEKSYD